MYTKFIKQYCFPGPWILYFLVPRQLVVRPQLLILRESSIGTLLFRVSQEQPPLHLLQMVTLSSLVISVTCWAPKQFKCFQQRNRHQ